MSLSTLNLPETRTKNLVRIAQLSIFLALIAAFAYVYLGAITQNFWFYHLIAGSFFLVTFVAILIVIPGKSGRPRLGVWHLISSIVLTALLISAIQAFAGAEVGSAVLIIIMVITLQTVPPEHFIRSAALAVIVSLACSSLAFFSPVDRMADAAADVVITWVARGAVLAFLLLIFTRFRNLNLTSKLLISFLGVVVLISMTFNILSYATTTSTLTDQIGQQLQQVATGRGLVIGDYLNGQIEVLRTLALNETLQQSVRAANALEPSLDSIRELDDQWKLAVANGTKDPLVNGRISNSLAQDLLRFQNLAPGNIEVFVTDNQGALIAATGITSDYYQADETWWQAAFRLEDAYISLPIFDESVGYFSVQVSVPIFDTRFGGLIGVLRSTFSIDSLISTIKEPIGKTGEADIYFSDGRMLDTQLGELKDVDLESQEAIRQLSNLTHIRYTSEEVDSILASAPIQAQAGSSKVDELHWSVIVSQDASEALAPVNQQARNSGFFTTLMAGFAAFLSLVVSQRLSNPITNLTSTANEIAQGNLKARVKVESQDETGQLSESFNTMAAKLQETLSNLEIRVAERTAELEKSTLQIQKRSNQFEAIAQLARTITSIQDLNKLLPRIAQLVSQHFGFYHVGLFLLDESRQYAVLSAANSEGGQRMLARKHRLGVGQTGIVGYVTSTGNPRIALDTGTDAVYFDNPDLPDTRSEMALPLRAGRTVIGALDVQSTEPNAFSEDDVEVLSILADEVSVAIENARLFDESQRVLADAQSAFGEHTRTAWQQMVARSKLIGYELSGTSIRSLEGPLINNGQTMAVPIKLRDRIVGAINISLPDNRELNPDEADITQALAQRVGIAIENATLLEETRRRATRESLIGDISAKLSETAEIERLMKVAVEELRQVMGAAEVSIRLSEQESPSE